VKISTDDLTQIYEDVRSLNLPHRFNVTGKDPTVPQLARVDASETRRDGSCLALA
jgi:hypothetical protein